MHLSALALCTLLVLTGCEKVTTTWDELARTNAEWATTRQLTACVTASGGVEPYGYGHIVFGTGGASVQDSARIFGLPGAAFLEE